MGAVVDLHPVRLTFGAETFTIPSAPAADTKPVQGVRMSRLYLDLAVACHRAAEDFGAALPALSAEMTRLVVSGDQDTLHVRECLLRTAQTTKDLMAARLVMAWLAANPDVANLIPADVTAGVRK